MDVADDLYARAADLASSSASSASPRAAHSALAADAVFADARLAQAQLALRRAVSASPDAATIRIADAEEAAASAVTAAESLGDPNHPRVALAVACSADVYVAKAVLAAKGGGGTGDGAGVMFAEGLYRNALRMLGTPRHPTATADDPDAAAGGAAHRIFASRRRWRTRGTPPCFARARQSRGGGGGVGGGGEEGVAGIERRRGCRRGGRERDRGVGRERVVFDAQLMIPIAANEWRR